MKLAIYIAILPPKRPAPGRAGRLRVAQGDQQKALRRCARCPCVRLLRHRLIVRGGSTGGAALVLLVLGRARAGRLPLGLTPPARVGLLVTHRAPAGARLNR